LVYEKRLSWYVALLPFLEEEGLYKQLDKQNPWDSTENLAVCSRSCGPNVLHCPAQANLCAEQGARPASYVAVAGVGADAALLRVDDKRAGMFGYKRRVSRKDVRDGMRMTLCFVESSRTIQSWTAGGPATVRPFDPNEQPYLGKDSPFGGLHPTEKALFSQPNVTLAARADASVLTLNNTVSPRVLEMLATINGGEIINEEF